MYIWLDTVDILKTNAVCAFLDMNPDFYLALLFIYNRICLLSGTKDRCGSGLIKQDLPSNP